MRLRAADCRENPEERRGRFSFSSKTIANKSLPVLLITQAISAAAIIGESRNLVAQSTNDRVAAPESCVAATGGAAFPVSASENADSSIVRNSRTTSRVSDSGAASKYLAAATRIQRFSGGAARNSSATWFTAVQSSASNKSGSTRSEISGFFSTACSAVKSRESSKRSVSFRWNRTASTAACVNSYLESTFPRYSFCSQSSPRSPANAK